MVKEQAKSNIQEVALAASFFMERREFMSRFDEVVQIVFAHEGGLSDNSADKGGRTNLGITQSTLMRARQRMPTLPERVDNLTVNQAKDIYRSLYWDICRCRYLEPPLDLLIFDAAVNCGTGGAGIQLQRALNKLGHNLAVDGAIGPATLAAMKYSHENELWRIVGAVLIERVAWHNAIIGRDKSQLVFIHGWLNRILKNASEVGL